MAATVPTAPVSHHGDHAHAQGHHGFAHPMPVWKLGLVFAALVALTVATVGASMLPLGPAEIYVSMGIATIKGLLVAFFFMHLLYDRPFNMMVFLGTFVFVALFVLFLVMDAQQYFPQVEAYSLDPTS